MRRYLKLFIAIAAISLCACEAHEDGRNGGEEQKPPRPENALSTLEDDREVSFADAAQVWADCFGDYYDMGLYMWGIYIQAYDTNEQVYVELLTASKELVTPTGKFTVTAPENGKWADRCILPGVMAEEYGEVYQAYSWYIQLDSGSGLVPVYLAQAPIVKGELIITEDSQNPGLYSFKFDFEDDAYNRITGEYIGGSAVEDFRQ